MPDCTTIYRMASYLAWANDVMLKNAEALPVSEIEAPRDTLFKSISGTFDHILVVAEMFLAHLEGRQHDHQKRYRNEIPPFEEVAARLRKIDRLFADLSKQWTQSELDEIISFQFVDGGAGSMSRADIVLHLVNHATYHRGFISTLLYPLKRGGAANDYTVFLRDEWSNIEPKRKDA